MANQQMLTETLTRLKKPTVTGTFDKNAKARVGLSYQVNDSNPSGIPLPVSINRKLFDRSQSVATAPEPGHNFTEADDD